MTKQGGRRREGEGRGKRNKRGRKEEDGERKEMEGRGRED